jgi:hypothetical protein
LQILECPRHLKKKEKKKELAIAQIENVPNIPYRSISSAAAPEAMLNADQKPERLVLFWFAA